jgi:hypothetical protein
LSEFRERKKESQGEEMEWILLRIKKKMENHVEVFTRHEKNEVNNVIVF